MHALLLIVSLSSSSPLPADDHLHIELIGHAVGSGSWAGGATATSWTQWQGYHGFREVSESEFFTIAGYDDEAEKARSYANTNRALFVGGLLLAVVGLGLIATDPEDNAVAGSIASTAGIIPMFIGATRSNTNYAPHGAAVRAADRYNNKTLAPLIQPIAGCVVTRSGC